MTDPNTVEQINAAHRAVIEAGNTGLDHAIAAGKLLAVMREKIKKEKGDWLEWLANNCPEISDRTDRLYRRLAKEELAIKKGGCRKWQRCCRIDHPGCGQTDRQAALTASAEAAR